MDLNVASDARMEPPIQVASVRSGGAWIRIRACSGSAALSSFSKRSPKPGKSVEPPERTMLPYNVWRRSRSARLAASATSVAAPGSSEPSSRGSKSACGVGEVAVPPRPGGRSAAIASDPRRRIGG